MLSIVLIIIVNLLIITNTSAHFNISYINATDEKVSTRRSSLTWRGISATVCRDFPGLSRDQAATCVRFPSEAAAALIGLRLAVAECQFQFRWHRWNCSSLRSSKSRNPHSTPLLNRGYRESAFAYAISAAGVMHAVSRACSLGRLQHCGCGGGSEDTTLTLERPTSLLDNQDFEVAEDGESDQTENSRRKRGTTNLGTRGQWQWGGCSHNLQFGARFSELFLDSRELKGGDLQARVNLHNNRAGRLAVLSHTQLRCKCHGLSGSCEVRTCWRAAPEFRRVGDGLKAQFRAAVLVDQGNLVRRAGGNSQTAQEDDTDEEADNSLHESGTETMLQDKGLQKIIRGQRKRRGRTWQQRRRVPNTMDLLYFQRSPSFCETSTDFPGTTGRRCHKNSSGMDGCASLCCGRGYNIIRQKRSERCLCRFHWCCQVVCKNCTVEEWVTECK